MALTPQEKTKLARQRKLDTALKYSLGTYSRRFVAPTYQRMIRAEAAALPAGDTPTVVDGELTQVFRRVGECVCITCGKVTSWSCGLGGMHTGHFLASRRSSILFVDENVAPQCSLCNRYKSGEPQKFRRWMLAVRGEETVERLERLNNQSVQFTREDLVDMGIGFAARLKVAEDRMNESTQPPFTGTSLFTENEL